MLRVSWLLGLTLFLFEGVCFPSSQASESAKQSIDFQRDIRPIFQSRCWNCHGERRSRGGISLTDRESAVAGGDSGRKAVVPHHSDKSELLRRVLSKEKKERMPPNGGRLTKAQIAKLTQWIEEGASWPDEEKQHWAYVKPKRPSLPKVQNPDWVKNPIDHFILAKLDANNLTPSAPAEKSRLIRRVYLDLIGLPPTVAQVDAFLQDNRPDAYERVVDELLASPHYGELWARHWLDLARYADSNGFQRDGFRSVWPYRDWVIKAFNTDMPFNQFTVEQIAGDLLPNATPSQKVATAFNRCTTVNVEAGVDREEDRVNGIFDRVSTTATVWLGTTMVCAQCHEHKYDPFTQEEYYRLFAYFNNTAAETKPSNSNAGRDFIGPKITLPLSQKAQAEKERWELLKHIYTGQLTSEVKKVRPGLDEWEKSVQANKSELNKLPKNIRTILKRPAKKRTKKHRAALVTYFTNLNPTIRRTRSTLKNVDAQLKRLQAPTCLVMQELETPRQTHVFKRGDFLDKLQRVQPGVPKVLHQLPTAAPPNRLGLAHWLVDPNNPLVARVTVNRWWAQFFGHGIVATLEDFGTQADAPTHPELLDWLATEFVRRDWSTKHIHRLIVTSATYRQSSKVSTELLRQDPKNLLYARAPRVRLSAELIRDNALAVSGLLAKKAGGPPVYPPQPKGLWDVIGRVDNTYRTSQGEDRYRRGIYTIWGRSSP
ncbi:MAG: PSD1 and planctomycete cytochrome C domain-containing protein [Gemmataceae bacterium]